MNSTSDFDSSSIIYRNVQTHEQQQAINLWYPTFKTNPDSESRYFSSDASPNYHVGDTLGAWHDNKLVSTVHIRRLTLRTNDDNEQYLCGGITNVVTLDEYRKHGLSRHLLQMAMDKMEESNQFDISLLGTGKTNHFMALGWEQVPLPAHILIDWKPIISSDTDVEWRSVSDLSSEDVEDLLIIHSNDRRLYQIDRSPSTIFQHWVKMRWKRDDAIVYLYKHENELGYVIIGKPDDENEVCVLEWQALTVNIEQKLLYLAAAEIRRRHGSRKLIRLFALPQYMTLEELIEWTGPVEIGVNQDIMMRNIRLPQEIYEKIRFAYCDGRTVFWSGDYF